MIGDKTAIKGTILSFVLSFVNSPKAYNPNNGP